MGKPIKIITKETSPGVMMTAVIELNEEGLKAELNEEDSTDIECEGFLKTEDLKTTRED